MRTVEHICQIAATPSDNACSGLVKNPPASLQALNLITNYRSLYKGKMRWWTDSDEEQMSLENHNEEMRCWGIQLFRPENGKSFFFCDLFLRKFL